MWYWWFQRRKRNVKIENDVANKSKWRSVRNIRQRNATSYWVFRLSVSWLEEYLSFHLRNTWVLTWDAVKYLSRGKVWVSGDRGALQESRDVIISKHGGWGCRQAWWGWGRGWGTGPARKNGKGYSPVCLPGYLPPPARPPPFPPWPQG